MSRVGQTRLSGHALIGEGRPAFRDFRNRAVCYCGAKSESGISQAAARRWITEHKDAVRPAVEGGAA